jgi:hypothetical protein
MTCEVAVMNRRGIALAADSAVTLGEGEKIYHTAEKLFSLSSSVPVAIMTCGAADMMSVPWETVIKIYAEKLGSRKFDTLDQYATDFLSFIEGATTLFPAEDQKHCIEGVVRAVWSDLYHGELIKEMTKAPKKSGNDMIGALSDIIRKDHEVWETYSDLKGLGPKYGTSVVDAYAETVNQIESQVFAGLKLTDRIRKDLRKTVDFMFRKDWFHPHDKSGIVIAGMGSLEPFPALLYYDVGTIAAGKLRYKKVGDERIGSRVGASVKAFAQGELIDMIINGIHPRLQQKLVDDVARWLPDAGAKKTKRAKAKGTDKRKEEFEKYLYNEIAERYEQPFMDAVSALPRQDLAKMAEALVSLTVFRMRMSADKKETVAEPIDVAVLSKGDGFIWIKRKQLMQHAV